MWRSHMIVGMVVVFALQGCSSADHQYFDSGIGTELAYSTLPTQTASQNSYVKYICQQAGSSSCAVDWNTFVQAGMNDIDQRCDGYLAWLDARRRSSGPILEQISDTATAADAILTATKAGSVAISVVGTALGFARETFNNINSRLIMEVNHSTVQSIVLSNQTRFRDDLVGKSIGTRPEALYALRQYLRICMPFTIETEINNTLTTFAQGGAGALEDREPLIDTAVIGAPKGPGGKVEGGKYQVPPVDRYAIILANPKTAYAVPYVRNVLSKICVPLAEQDKPTKKTIARILAYQQWRQARADDKITQLTGKLTERELTLANDEQKPCDWNTYANYFERKTLTKGVTDPEVIDQINLLLPASKLPRDADQDAVRAGIALARKQVEKDLALKNPELSDQITYDFWQILLKS